MLHPGLLLLPSSDTSRAVGAPQSLTLAVLVCLPCGDTEALCNTEMEQWCKRQNKLVDFFL